jgi:hypothetical protein
MTHVSPISLRSENPVVFTRVVCIKFSNVNELQVT